MSQPLRLDLLPTGHIAVRAMALALTGSAIAISVLLPRHPAHIATAPVPELEAAATTLPVRVTRQEPTPPAAPPPGAAFELVFEAHGATYMRLADLERGHLPRHGRLQLEDENQDPTQVVATVAGADVPAAYRAWQGRAVVVHGTDGSRCTAHVTGFAIVSRLTGDPDYAGLDATHWTAASVLDQGATVLAARLDRCTGSYARDAALPPIVVPVAIAAPELAARATAALLASPAAAATQKAWAGEYGQPGSWTADPELAITSQVLRHPGTGVVWVSVHARREHGCGEPDSNVWGLFRVARDGSLVPAVLRQLGELDTIDQLLDVDGDGQLEVLGKPWLGLDRVLERADGHVLQTLSLPFYGCPC